MRTVGELTERINELARKIDAELDAPTEDPLRQWARLKAYHAMQVALEWALEDLEKVGPTICPMRLARDALEDESEKTVHAGVTS